MDLAVLGGVFVTVTAVYVGIVLGGGMLIGHTGSPHVGLSVLATAVVALGLEPLRARLHAAGERRFTRVRATPYDVLSRFSESLTGDSDPSGGSGEQDELPLRMARLLAEGTGASWAQVWLVVGDEPVLAAAWPPGDDPAAHEPRAGGPGRRSLDVVLAGRRLGILRLQERPDEPLSPVEERLFADLAAQAGLALQGARLRAELMGRAVDLAVLAADLQASRRRVVDAHDAERRRLERDIHDGAQQHLVALVVNLRLAQTLAGQAPARARVVLAQQNEAVHSAITSLVDLARGIYPEVLADGGVAAAVRDVVSTSTIPVTVLDHGIGRHDEEIEAALYFCCVEAVQNAVKHAGATRVDVELGSTGEQLWVRTRDDGQGFDVAAVLAAGGLATIRDRVDAVAGDLDVRVNDSGGIDIVVTVPVIGPVPGSVVAPVLAPAEVS